MRVLYYDSYDKANEEIATMYQSLLKFKKDAVLGLATGSTPLGLYRKLVELNKEKKIDFSKAVTFNLDEYVGLPVEHPESYYSFMHRNLFDKVNISKNNIHIPDGNASDVKAFCEYYDKHIEESGYIDLQLLGIGGNGHIGFNEPSGSFACGTHIVTLKENTRLDNSRFFNSLDEVPKEAITMGLKQIMNARCVVLLACGAKKKEIFEKAIKGAITPEVPASVLQLHRNAVMIYCEEEAK